MAPSFEVPPPSEAFAALLALAERRTGAIPAELLVRHLLVVTAGGDWPVQRASWEALLRRLEFARRDRLVVAARPRTIAGIYVTRRARSQERPYRTLLLSLEPLAASCDCPDFLRGSLGLCKHLLVVLEDLAKRPRRWNELARQVPAIPMPLLGWDPIRPLTGEGDWLERVRLNVDSASARARRGSLRRWFGSDGNAGQRIWVPKETYPREPKSRLALVEALRRATDPKPRGGARHAGDGLVDPALSALLEAEVERLRRTLALKGGSRALRRALGGLKRKLYPYQIEGVERFLAAGRLLLADDMGLGKTVQGIAACHALHATGRVRRGLLVVPATLKEQWRREWQATSDVPVEIVEGPAESRRATYARCRSGFLISNYEQVLRDLDAIRAWRPEIVVLDEAQRIKNWATKTAACVKELRPTYRLVLTGTPMENRLDELASIMDWVDDLALEPKWRLVPWHAELADGRREVVGARNLDTLRQRLSGSLVRRVRQEVLKQLPPRTDTVVPVELTPAQAEEHEELERPIAALVQRARKRPLTQAEFLRLMTLLTTQRIIANGMAQLNFEQVWPSLAPVRRPDPALLGGLSTPKLLALRDVVAQIVVGQQRKAVVFSQWRRMLLLAQWAVADLMSDAGVRSVFFTGHEADRRRTQNIVDLHDDPRTVILFASDAGGVGLNLQRAASCCVNLDLPWNPAVLEQRIGRIYRLGQRKPIDVYHLVTQGSIEERISGLIASKRAFFANLFDGASDEVRFEHSGSFLSRLERLLEPLPTPAEGAAPATEDEVEVGEEAALVSETRAPAELGDEIPASDANAASGVLTVVVPEGPTPAVAAAPPVPLQQLLSRLQLRPRGDGGLIVEAPPEAAEALATLLEGLASALRAGSSASG